MKIVVAGQGDVGMALAECALLTGHDVIGFDTITETKAELTFRLEQGDLPKALMDGYESRRYELILEPEDLPTGWEVALFTPNEIVNDQPHTRWTRFRREMTQLGHTMSPGATVILHCASLQPVAMMHDAEVFIRTASGCMNPDDDYNLAWSGADEGDYFWPDEQKLFVAGWNQKSQQKALEQLIHMGITQVTSLDTHIEQTA
jgi:UDP-N-acetyl-D-mannosaminuronate dehydrogenase